MKFELSSLSFAINVPVHDDTEKIRHSCMDTKNGHPAANFSGALVASGREFIGDSRERAVAGGPFTADSLFPPKLTKQRKSHQSAL